MTFPLVSVVIGVLLVAIPTTFAYINLERFAQHSDKARFSAGPFQAVIPRNQFAARALMFGTYRTAHIIGAIDLAGSYAMTLGYPPNVTLDAWRSLVLPFSSLPFWWFTGMASDAFLGRRRLHWSVLSLGCLFLAFFLIMLLGLRFGLSPSERAESDLGWVYWGTSIWILLFASFPLAWMRQNRAA